jgi:PhnB protein
MAAMSESAEIAIERLIRAWAKAIGERRAEVAAACQSAQPVEFGLAPPLRVVGDPTKAMVAWFETWDGRFCYEPHDLEIAVDGTVAFAHCFMRLVGTKVTGEEVALWFRQTLGLRRQAIRWTIVHVHQSVPFLMDGSALAALSLKPV